MTDAMGCVLSPLVVPTTSVRLGRGATVTTILDVRVVDVREKVFSQFEQVAQEQGKVLAPLSDGVPLLETGLDSLCFAIIVARLEDELGCDPFSASDEVAFPVTVGDLIGLYQDAAK